MKNLTTPKKPIRDNTTAQKLPNLVPSQTNIYDDQPDVEIQEIDSDTDDSEGENRYPPQTFGELTETQMNNLSQSPITQLSPSKSPIIQLSPSRSPITQIETQISPKKARSPKKHSQINIDTSPISQIESQQQSKRISLSPGSNYDKTTDDSLSLICDLTDSDLSLELTLDEDDTEPSQEPPKNNHKKSIDLDSEMEDVSEEEAETEDDEDDDEDFDDSDDKSAEEEEEEEEIRIVPDYKSWISSLIKHVRA